MCLLFLGESVVSLVAHRATKKIDSFAFDENRRYRWYSKTVHVCVFLWDRGREWSGARKKKAENWVFEIIIIHHFFFISAVDMTSHDFKKHCHRNNSDCANWRSHLHHGNNNPKKNPKYYSLHGSFFISIWLILFNSFDSAYVYFIRIAACLYAGAYGTLSLTSFSSIFQLKTAARCSYFIPTLWVFITAPSNRKIQHCLSS